MSEKSQIEDLLKQAISLYSKEGSAKNELILYYKFQKILYVISDLLDFPSKINNREKRNLIERVIEHLRSSDSIDYQVFYKSLLEEDKKRLKWEKYSFLFSFNISEEYMKFFEGLKLGCYSLENINKDYFLNKLKENLKIAEVKDYFAKSEWARVIVHASDKEQASKLGWLFSERIRALINFILTFNKINYVSHPMQLSRISPSHFYFLFDVDDNYIEYYKQIEEYRYKTMNFCSTELDNIVKFIKDFNNLPDSKLKNVLLECFQLYNIAIDSSKYDYSFIVLWSIIDILVDVKKGKDILKKLYYKTPNERLMCLLIDALYNKRNQLIHQGRVLDIDIDDINYLKSIIASLLWFVFELLRERGEKFGNLSQLREILSILDFEEDKLQERIDMISYIKGMRIKSQ
ncbi:MAG: hypothetical protein QXE51_04735 [Nitrososphaeria archaeon]